MKTEKSGFYPLKEKTTDSSLFRKNDGFCPFPCRPSKNGRSEPLGVGLLLKSLYGTRDAAKNFQEEVKRFLLGLGFTIGKYNTSTAGLL